MDLIHETAREIIGAHNLSVEHLYGKYGDGTPNFIARARETALSFLRGLRDDRLERLNGARPHNDREELLAFLSGEVAGAIHETLQEEEMRFWELGGWKKV